MTLDIPASAIAPSGHTFLTSQGIDSESSSEAGGDYILVQSQWDLSSAAYEEVDTSSADVLSDSGSNPTYNESGVQEVYPLYDDFPPEPYPSQVIPESVIEKTYITLESRKHIKQEEDSSSDGVQTSIFDPDNFKPESWKDTQVIGFLYHTGNQLGWDMSEFHGENFQGVNGLQLFEMTEAEVTSREPRYGNTIHQFLAQFFHDKSDSSPGGDLCNSMKCPTSHLQNSDSLLFQPVRDECVININGHKYDYDPNPSSIHRIEGSDSNTFAVSCKPECGTERYTDCMYAAYCEDNNNYISNNRCKPQQFHTANNSGKNLAKNLSLPSFTDTYHPLLSRDSDRYHPLLSRDHDACLPVLPRDLKPPFSDESRFYRDGSYSSDDYDMLPLVSEITDVHRLRRGSTGSSVCEVELQKPTKKHSNRGRKPGQCKGNHLWEFIRDLLYDSAYNPNIIKWEDFSAGVFRIVQSRKVADLWGQKKKNNRMNYEKLSRALRFSRTAGYFADLPKNRNFPKKLCFKFGTKAVL